MTDFKRLKDLYEDGYRCIFHDSSEDKHKIYLKNFDTEVSETVELKDTAEFETFKSYIGDLRSPSNNYLN